MINVMRLFLPRLGIEPGIFRLFSFIFSHFTIEPQKIPKFLATFCIALIIRPLMLLYCNDCYETVGIAISLWSLVLVYCYNCLKIFWLQLFAYFKLCYKSFGHSFQFTVTDSKYSQTLITNTIKHLGHCCQYTVTIILILFGRSCQYT